MVLPVLLLLGIYTAVLIYLGRMGRRKSKSQNFIHGGRQFSSWQVFFMISALWCSWIFIVEVETAYLFGVSAVWFGVAVGLMALISVYLLATPFRKLSFVTNSGIIGERFGPAARAFAGVVIGLTFPIFAMSNVLAAAAFLHVVLGWPLVATLVGSILVILVYVVLGGIWALAYTQIANFIVMCIGLVAGTLFALHAVPVAHMTAQLPPHYFALNGVGIGIILTWFASDLLNVVSAQAEFQILTAARDMGVARRGLYWALFSIAVFSVLSVIIGMAARTSAAGHKILGVIAFPELFVQHAPAPLVALMTLCIWATALTWSAPLMFSGASSLGADVLGLVRKASLNENLRFCVQVCLPVQALLIIAYALMRPEDLAWWQVFALTVRNGAIFAPTIALLLWPVATRSAAIVSILGGSLSGLFWNYLGGFSVSKFAFGLNPMWVSATVGIALLIAITLVEPGNRYRLGSSNNRTARIALFTGAAGVALIACLIAFTGWFVKSGLFGPGLLVLAVDGLIVAALMIQPGALASARQESSPSESAG